MAAKCKHISYDTLRGTECGLTGTSVGSDCGNPTGADAIEMYGECIPCQALRYLRGDRAAFANLNRVDREVVMATAATIRERMRAGEFRESSDEHTTRVGKEAKQMAESKAVTDLSSMTSEQLLALAVRAKAAAREREKADRQAAAARPALVAEHDRCMGRLHALAKAVEDLDEGKPVDLKALGVRIGRTANQARAPQPAGQGQNWTPERRLQMSFNILERNAKRYKWPAKKLAEAKDRARKKAAA